VGGGKTQQARKKKWVRAEYVKGGWETIGPNLPEDVAGRGTCVGDTKNAKRFGLRHNPDEGGTGEGAVYW